MYTGGEHTLKRTTRTWVIVVPTVLFLLTILSATNIIFQQVQQDRLDRALITAIRRLDAPTTISLLNKGANPNARDTSTPPLTIRKVVERLLSRLNSKPGQSSQKGRIALVVASMPVGFAPTVNPAAMETINVALLQHGADCRLDDSCAEVLSHALQSNMHQSVRLLVEKGADVTKNCSGRPPLCYADRENTLYLLQHGADANAKDGFGCSPLAYAVSLCQTDVINILLDHGANVNCVDRIGHSILYDATGGINESTIQHDVIRLLKEHGAKLNHFDEVTKRKRPN